VYARIELSLSPRTEVCGERGRELRTASTCSLLTSFSEVS
jgi:hypothetical protein